MASEEFATGRGSSKDYNGIKHIHRQGVAIIL